MKKGKQITRSLKATLESKSRASTKWCNSWILMWFSLFNFMSKNKILKFSLTFKMILIWKSFLEKGGRVNFLLSSENWGPIKVIINTLLGTTELSVCTVCLSLDMYWFMYWGHSTLSTLTYQLRKHWSKWGDYIYCTAPFFNKPKIGNQWSVNKIGTKRRKSYLWFGLQICR